VPAVRAGQVNLDCLNIAKLDFTSMNDRFTEEEIWSVIHTLLLNKAPREENERKPYDSRRDH
jgi:hypothetical protein